MLSEVGDVRILLWFDNLWIIRFGVRDLPSGEDHAIAEKGKGLGEGIHGETSVNLASGSFSRIER